MCVRPRRIAGCIAFFLVTAAVAISALPGADPRPPRPLPPARADHPRGHRTPTAEKLAASHAAAAARHGDLVRRLPRATAAQYDCRALGLVPPVTDQGDCGSCWDFSGTSVCTSALIKAAIGKPDGSFMLSEQYTLDCGQNGGCDGDDNTTVTAWAKATGLPTRIDYGPYTARPGPCRMKAGTTLYKIADWGFATPTQQQGIASTDDIKACMVAFGPIGSAIAATDGFANTPAGKVFTGDGSTDVNHDVVLVGWDNTKGPGGAWILRNSWGANWCDGGYCYIAYTANQIGTEAIWATASPIPSPPVPPPPPTPPSPPTPTPPPGPLPPPPATANPAVSIVITYRDGSVQAIAGTSSADPAPPPAPCPCCACCPCRRR